MGGPQIAGDAVYFTPPETLTAAERTQLVARAIGIVEGTMKQVLAEDDPLYGVEMVDGLGCELDEQGWVTVDSAGDRSAAAIALNADLVEEDVRFAVYHFTQGFTS